MPNEPPFIVPEDGRQSETARAIARGATRCLVAYGFAVLPEVTLANGRRADLVAVSAKSEIWIIEIKSSLADFRADQKWPEYKDFCDKFYFAVEPTFPLDILPGDAGLIVADRYGGDIMRQPVVHVLAAARRKALLTLCATTAAARLTALADPEAAIDRGRL